MLRDIEEPIEMSNANTANFKEKLGQQEEKVELFSRWTKYLDKKCEEQEEEALQAEEQAYFSKGDIVKHTRKRKKSDLYTTDTQRHEKRNVSGFTDDVKRFEENSNDSVTVSTKCCGDTTCKNMLIPDVKEHMIHRKNQDPCSKGAGLSKWDKFLLSGKSYTSDVTTSALQKRQETLAETSVVGGNVSADTSGSISFCNYHHAAQQNVAIPCEGAEEVNPIHITLASIPVGRSRKPPSLPSAQFQQRLLNRLPEKTTSTHSTSIVAVSSSKTPPRSFFSIGEDFDDDI
ncbi:MRN complex-interacting protein isoform X2 [Sceloporus undulatus]|nr:MRN complex-interacting protein isoform X2 [Sceloporus undulatus]